VNLAINQWLVGLLTLAITLLTAVNAMPASAWTDPPSVLQFVALALSSVLAVALKLGKGRWPGVFKTGVAVALAAIGAAIPLLTQGWYLTPAQIIVLVVAALNALAIELGVQVRVASAKQAVVDPNISTATVKEVDPAATRVATLQVARDHSGT
jgi:hypothetical protein